jgi:hypothetical protein
MSAADGPSFPIDPPSDPSREFLQAYRAAGLALQAEFNIHRGQVEPSRDYNWIKAQLTWPSFDHLTFGFSNQVFSVLVELTDGTRTSLSPREIQRCLDAAQEYGLVPCVFPVDPRTLQPRNQGWNLFDLDGRRPIVPDEVATDERIPMSEWELRNFAIQVVRSHIEEKLNGRIHSCCDVIGIDPQIWFEDSGGDTHWVVVRFYPVIRGDERNEFIGLEHSNPPLRNHDGHFAAVSAASSEPVLYDLDGRIIPLSRRFDGTAPLYRGDGFYVKFDGLQRIHVS